MTAEQATALIVAVTGLVAALGVIIAQLRQTHGLVNSRMSQLLETTQLANQKIGELRGRDFAKSIATEVALAVPIRTEPPSPQSTTSTPGTSAPNPGARKPAA